MTVEEIQALIVINEDAEAVLREDLKEAIAKLQVEAYMAAFDLIVTDFDADTITASRAKYLIEVLKI